MIFHKHLFLIQKSVKQAQAILCYGIMLFIMCHFPVKTTVFFELVNVIYFSILLTFRISAMRLFIFINFLSLDLCTYNLNISRMWLIDFFVFKNGFLACRIKNPKNGVKDSKIKLLWKLWTKFDHNHLTRSHS